MKKIIWEENVKSLLYEIVENNTSGELKSILTEKPLVYYFWKDFSEAFMRKRVERNIFLKSLRLTPKNYDTQEHQDYIGYLKETQHVDTNENLWADVVFLEWDRVILFDVENMTAMIDDSQEKCNTYHEVFEKYWGENKR